MSDAALNKLAQTIVDKAEDGKGCRAYADIQSLSLADYKTVWHLAGEKAKGKAEHGLFPNVEFKNVGTETDPIFDLERHVSPRGSETLLWRYETTKSQEFVDKKGTSQEIKTNVTCGNFPTEGYDHTIPH